jgi:tetratricopeptide (TPR) repeat protein
LPSRWGMVVLGCAAAISAASSARAADARSIGWLSQSLAAEESRSGDVSPHLLPLLDRLAGAQFDNGALGEAAGSRRRALKIALRAYGGASIDTANAMIALANVEILQGHYVKAEPLLIGALPVLEARFGAENAALAEPLAALGRIALARGDTAAAQNWADRAVAIAGRHASAISSEPQRVLGAVYAAERRFDDGERVLRAAAAHDRQRYGADSPELARSLAQLANLLLRAQRFAEALPVTEQAIAIDQEHLGPNHPLIADDFTDLGMIYAGLGRDADAGAALYFAVDLLTRDTAEESPRIAYAELELSSVLRRLGQTADADAAFKDAKAILDRTAKDERKRERQA